MMTNTENRQNKRPLLSRAALTKQLVGKLKNQEAVVGGIGWTNFELWAAGHRAQNFYMLGSMGLALPIALGVAIAQPQRRVIGLEGDGSLLMQVGALGTIAARSPKNLIMVVWDNEAYQITGGQPTTTARVVDIVALARASGLDKATWAESESHFSEFMDRALLEDGPHFVACKIDNAKPAMTTRRDPVQIREWFMNGLGVRKAPAVV